VTPDQFLLIADPLPEPMLLLSGEGLIVAGNRALEVRLQIAPLRLRGRRLAEVVADPTDEVAHYLRSCSRSRTMVLGALVLFRNDGIGIACRSEGMLVRPKADGNEALLMIRLIPKESASGQFIALNQRIEDLGREIQRRKAAEEEARRQEEQLRVTLRSIGDAVIVTDPYGRVTSLNVVAEGLTGWLQVEAAGQPLEVVFRIENEQTRRRVENPALRALREGVIVGLANHTILVAKNGAEHAIDDSAAPIRDSGGHVIGAVLVFRDITERRAAERRILEGEVRKAAIVDSALDCIITIDHEGKVLEFNPAAERTFGYRRADVIGRAMGDLIVPPAMRTAHRDGMTRYLATGDGPVLNRRLELTALRSDGTEFPVEVTISRIPGGGDPVFTGYLRDITERKKAEEERKESEARLRRLAADLSEANRRKDEFLATLAHELRNPLAPIRNGLQLMQMAGDTGDAIKQARTMMERQLAQLVRLVDDLLDVSRITRGRLELRRERIDLSTVMNSAVEASRPLIEQMGHELTVTLPETHVTLDADLTRLAQVIMNLLNNAAKYSDRGGRIALIARRDADEVVVRVRDTGIGIAADQLPHVFEMFSQVDHSLEKSQGGLGIGLTLVRRLVELHGGTVEAFSQGIGAGAEFVVRLPLAVDVMRPPIAQSLNKSTPHKSSRRILIVDDNRDNADSLSTMLKGMGNVTRTAYDGEEAVTSASEFRPDVILLDIGLPRLNGYEVCQRLRQQLHGKKVLIIAQTGWGTEGDRERTREAGFDHHLVKPVDPEALLKLLWGL
jgi:PAS domain S-box-containing protein